MKAISLTSNQLKLIAILTMFFDHFMAVFVSHNSVPGMALRLPGRIVAPIMCFLIAEGFYKTSNVKKYILRLLIFALISHIPYNLCFGYSLSPLQATSVMWGLAMGLIALAAIKSEAVSNLSKTVVLCLCCLLAMTANWNYIAVLWIVMFGVLHGNFRRQMIGFCVISVLFHLIPTYLNFGIVHEGYPHWYQLGVFLAILILSLYHGERGKKSKAMTCFFYWFYPLHLMIIYCLAQYTILPDLIRGGFS